jgi:hypothetical protein
MSTPLRPNPNVPVFGVPTELTPSPPGVSIPSVTSTGGDSAQAGLGQINTGSQTVGSAIGRASQALGTGGSQNSATNFKKGGKVTSKGRDWHGFGIGGTTGDTKHGF